MAIQYMVDGHIYAQIGENGEPMIDWTLHADNMPPQKRAQYRSKTYSACDLKMIASNWAAIIFKLPLLFFNRGAIRSSYQAELRI